jgi:hypothetical protein
MNSLITERTILEETSPKILRFAGFILPITVLTFKAVLPPWIFMWVLSAALYIACKWLVFCDAQQENSPLRQKILFLFVYPGMDGWSFFRRQALQAEGRPIGPTLLKIVVGIMLFVGALCVAETHSSVAAWVGMVAIVLFLHFGIFEIAALALQLRGFSAPAMMNRPIATTSLAQFWGRRWNRDFHILTERYVFKQLLQRFGSRSALFAGFLLSGVIHEFVITFPAGGGYGGPTAYFLLQALGMLVERKCRKRGMLRSKFSGWFYTVFFTLGPVGLLFPIEFRERVILPMLKVIGGL